MPCIRASIDERRAGTGIAFPLPVEKGLAFADRSRNWR